MKRAATTCVLLAGLGGGCVSPEKKEAPPSSGYFGRVTKARENPRVQGPGGEPVAVMAARGATPGATTAGYARVGMADPNVKQAGYVARVPGDYGSGVVPAAGFGGPAGGVPPMGGMPMGGMPMGGMPMGGPPMGGGMMGMGPSATNPELRPYYPVNPPGILPVPGMGPPGAVAAVGAIVPGMQMAPNGQRTSVKFGGPAGMSVTWQLPGGVFTQESQALVAPAAYNFMQGQVYRLKLSRILPNHPGKFFYPTLEVVPGNPKTVTFLAHSSVPVVFTPEDFDQCAAGNLVVKVVYLPDPVYQDYATVAGAEEIVSTRLEPGTDPVIEAQKRGTILAIIRMGNIDLENPASPAMGMPPGMPPGVPPGFGPGGPPPGAAPGLPPVVSYPPGMPAPGVTPAPVAPKPVPPAPPAAPGAASRAPAVLPPVAPSAPLPPAGGAVTGTTVSRPPLPTPR